MPRRSKLPRHEAALIAESKPDVRSIWFVEKGEEALRFVTAYPLERRKG